MATGNSLEKGPSNLSSVETNKLIVSQPAKLVELGQLLETIDNLSQRVSEQTSEDRSADMGGAGGMVTSAQGSTGISPRDEAIANIPQPVVMQKKLEDHIKVEMKTLRSQARSIANSEPGSAYKLNEIYARIRRLQGLLSEILEASYELLKKFFIRVFIDRQPIL